MNRPSEERIERTEDVPSISQSDFDVVFDAAYEEIEDSANIDDVTFKLDMGMRLQLIDEYGIGIRKAIISELIENICEENPEILGDQYALKIKLIEKLEELGILKIKKPAISEEREAVTETLQEATAALRRARKTLSSQPYEDTKDAEDPVKKIASAVVINFKERGTILDQNDVASILTEIAKKGVDLTNPNDYIPELIKRLKEAGALPDRKTDAPPKEAIDIQKAEISLSFTTIHGKVIEKHKKETVSIMTVNFIQDLAKALAEGGMQFPENNIKEALMSIFLQLSKDEGMEQGKNILFNNPEKLWQLLAKKLEA